MLPRCSPLISLFYSKRNRRGTLLSLDSAKATQESLIPNRASEINKSLAGVVFTCHFLHTSAIQRSLKSKKDNSMNDQQLREHLLFLLGGGGAHLDFDAAVEDLTPKLRGKRPANIPHTPWRLVEHMRICQWDILEFSRNTNHVSPEFPDGYWPADDAPADDHAWEKAIEGFRTDLEAMQELVADPSVDLFAPIPHGNGQTILREALLVADHNAYHLGQLVTVRRALGAWPAE